MKRVGYIFERICDLENIKTAIMKSSLGKRGQKRVKEILENIDAIAEIIQKCLLIKNIFLHRIK